MANYAQWRAVSTTLFLESRKWRDIDDAARVLWLGLLLASDNHGAIEGDIDTLRVMIVRRLGKTWTVAKVDRAVNMLDEAGLVQLYDNDGDSWLQLTDFDDHQPGEYIRKRGVRRSPVPPSCVRKRGHARTDAHTDAQATPPRQPSALKKKEKKKKTEQTMANSALQGDVRSVFDHWVEVDVSTGGGQAANRLLNGKRVTLIKARLAEGYTVEQLCQSITGHCNDPWHKGSNPSQRRYTGLQTLLKHGDKVEVGIQLLTQQTATVDKPQRFEQYAGADHVIV